VTDWLYDVLFISPAGWWIGGGFIYLSIAAVAGLLIHRYGGVRMTEPDIPLSEATTVELPPKATVTHTEFRYTVMDEWYPMAGYLAAAIDATAEAVTEVIEAIEADPLDVTHEIETVDPHAPLFYQIKRPPPYDGETFTVGWTRERIAEVIANRGHQ
jgi:hypothetical protein